MLLRKFYCCFLEDKQDLQLSPVESRLTRMKKQETMNDFDSRFDKGALKNLKSLSLSKKIKNKND